MGIHDIYLKYISLRRNIDPPYGLGWYIIPWMGPSIRSMIRFGAFYPIQILTTGRRVYWRFITSSIWATSSIVEWFVLLIAWLHVIPQTTTIPSYHQQPQQYSTVTPFMMPSSSTYPTYDNDNNNVRTRPNPILPLRWPVIYILSAMTGQLWMMAFYQYYDNYSNTIDGTVDDESSNIGITNNIISGCTSWGTAGVLCATGMQYPERRFELFILAIIIILLNLFQPTSSVYGAIGATFFGWSFSSIWLPSTTTASSNNKNSSTPGASTWHYYSEVDDGDYKESASKPIRQGWTCWNILALIFTACLWVLPIVYMILYW